jgi:Flp pilus assembly protein TadG
MRRKFLSPASDERGSVLLEFALAVPLLIAVGLFAGDVGQRAIEQSRAERAVGEAMQRSLPAAVSTANAQSAANAAAASLLKPSDDQYRVEVVVVAWDANTTPTVQAQAQAGMYAGGGAPVVPAFLAQANTTAEYVRVIVHHASSPLSVGDQDLIADAASWR